ncbi:MAG: DUF3616 domain-containing protein [Pirellulales bacterium]
MDAVRLILCLFGCLTATLSWAKAPTWQPIEFQGAIIEREDLSAVAVWNRGLIVASDERAALQRLDPVDGRNRCYRAVQTIRLDREKVEVDVEGLATDRDTIYVLGSHSLIRPRIDRKKDLRSTRKEIVRRLLAVVSEPSRDQVFRIRLTPDGRGLRSFERITLRSLIAGDPLLARFASIPGKENGIDLEGLAVADGKLIVGCRGPVLRANFVPVLLIDFDRPRNYQMKLIRLDGRGIRSLARVSNGFLLIGGPVGDGDAPFLLYHWDGGDQTPGQNVAQGRVVRLATVPSKPLGRPEGLAVLEETADSYRLLVVYDGVPRGGPIEWRVGK